MDSTRSRSADPGRSETPFVGGAGSTFIGNVVYQEVGISNNVPFAAAFATVPLVIMGIYLLVARRLGAFEAL